MLLRNLNLLALTAEVAFCCVPAIAQNIVELPILTGISLGSGYYLNLDTSDLRRDWLSNDGSSLIMRYPGAPSTFGFVSITPGPLAPLGSRPSLDASGYQTLVLEMRGDQGSSVDIGIKDWQQPDDGSETKVHRTVSSDWQTYSIPLSQFLRVDLKHVYFLAEIVFNGSNSQTLQVRNIKYTTAPASITKILPQLVFGGGWYTAVYITNTSLNSVSVQLGFFAEDGTPLGVPSAGGSSMTINLGARATALVEAPNVGPLNVGYISVSMPDAVTGYGVFRFSSPGQADQEVGVPLSSSSATTSTLIWDDTNVVTAVPIVNPSNVATTVSITVRDTSGQNSIGVSSVSLPPKGHMAVVLRNLPGLGGIAGQRGSADFSVTSGNVAVLGLRFNGTAFTSIPTADR